LLLGLINQIYKFTYKYLLFRVFIDNIMIFKVLAQEV